MQTLLSSIQSGRDLNSLFELLSRENAPNIEMFLPRIKQFEPFHSLLQSFLPGINNHHILFINEYSANLMSHIFALERQYLPAKCISFGSLHPSLIIISADVFGNMPARYINICVHEYFHTTGGAYNQSHQHVKRWLAEGITTYQQEKHMKIFFEQFGNDYDRLVNEFFPLPFDMQYTKDSLRKYDIPYPEELAFVKSLVRSFGENVVLSSFQQGIEDPLSIAIGDSWQLITKAIIDASNNGPESFNAVNRLLEEII